METCVHRVFLDPERDRWEDGIPCGKEAVSFSTYTDGLGTVKLFWCARHTREDAKPIDAVPDGISEYYASKRKDLERAQEALDAAIDRDAPQQTITRLQRARDLAAYVGD